MNLSALIKNACLQAFCSAFPEQKALFHTAKVIEITQATQQKFGDYQCNTPMKLTKQLGVAPRLIAEKVTEQLNNLPLDVLAGKDWNGKEIKSINFNSIFSNIEIAGPGFINLTLDPVFLSFVINQHLYDPLRLGVPKPDKPLKVIIDYSSPNVAKEMHVGHLRTTIIGDCLARLFRFLGHEVLALNHIGDWGTQFGMLITYLKEVIPAITEKTPPQVNLQNLVEWYRASKKRFDEDPDFKKRAQQEVVALQSGNEISLRTWEHICGISRKAYQDIYDLLNVRLVERGESFYNPFLPGIIQDLEEKQLLKMSDGAKCVFLEGFTNRNGDPLPLILQKADGAYNYATTDLAAIRHRVTEEHGDWIIYVVDAGQSQHLQMVFETARKAGYCDPHPPTRPEPVRLDHVEFGLVLRPDGKKFKTREGETERLIDLLQNAIEKAKQILQEKNPTLPAEEIAESAHILGIDAVKYADLSCHRTSDYMFSFDKMLSFEGNTAAFLLYAYVRALSIQQKIKDKTSVEVLHLLQTLQQIQLQEPAEISLGLMVCQFPETLEQTAQELLPNRLTDYLYRLAEKFHVFFHQCRVEGSDAQNSRLLLCLIVARTFEQGFKILGLKTLKRM